MKYKSKNLTSAAAVIVFLLLLTTSAVFLGKQSPHSGGQIFLYGESHGEANILAEEFRLWEKYYNENGMRDLFIEVPYYTAEFLNIWMLSENDDILNEIFDEIKGTATGDSVEAKKFYQNIKASCPETVFHGTDVGALDYITHSVPCMATQLAEYYGESLKSEDLTLKY